MILDSKKANLFAKKLNENRFLANISKHPEYNIWTVIPKLAKQRFPWKELVFSYSAKGKWTVSGRDSVRSFCAWSCNTDKAMGWLMGNLQANTMKIV